MLIDTENFQKTKDKSPWYCLCCPKKEMSFYPLRNEHLEELMHGKVNMSLNKKITTNVIRQTKLIGEKLLNKAF